MALKYSSQIYEKAIKSAFFANAGEDNPDPEAFKEVQKAMVIFVKNVMTQVAERSAERDKNLEKLYPEDLVYIFRDNPKYLDAISKSMLYFQVSQECHKISKKIKGLQLQTDYKENEDENDFTSKSIERYQNSQFEEENE